MAARNAEQFVMGLKDDRRVWLGDEEVDVTRHASLKGSLKGVAGYFDWQNAFADDCLVMDEASDAPMSASLLIPANAHDLAVRNRCFDRLSKYSYGMLGRTPDYVGVTLAGFIARSDLFAAGSKAGADRLSAFYREVVEKDLALTHALIQPAIDRSIGDLQGLNGELALRIVEHKKDHVVLRGAKVLATLAPFSDEVFVYPQLPLPPGSDPSHAICFSIPVATKGVVTLCRDHYGIEGDTRDFPFSSRFDEQDAFMIFDDVELPIERLFIDCDLELYNKIRGTGWAGNVFQQTAIRAANKLEFAHELGSRMAQVMNAHARPDYAAMLGEIWTFAQLTRSAIKAAELGARDWGNGAFFCDDRPLRAIRDIMPTWMARVNEVFMAIGSHNLLATPSLRAFDNPKIRGLLERYLPGANGMSAQERAQVFRAAWDFAGSALGNRIELYEQFYLAGQPRNYTRDHVQRMQEQDFGEQVEGFFLRQG